ncbi:MAG: hypothetical protein LBC87_06000 [Fibromonadaceae bacterium]|jgi:uncharacterized protein (TIGR02145 family)|nr:hypothetical protein [Fibromonadaceae bacterium]
MVLRFSIFAVAFLLSCTSIERDSVCDEKSIKYNGCVGDIFVYGDGDPVTYEGETYETVVIGTQIWMARNLNYKAPGSACYNHKESNCTVYGRFYDWATAMGIDAEYNSEWWDINGVNEKHQGICPNGWHIPSVAEWTTLENFVGSSVAGTKLKATSGWFNYERYPEGNGDDAFGFSALPGGYLDSEGYLAYEVSSSGYWWTASEFSRAYAHSLRIIYDDYIVEKLNNDKSYMYNVRCLKD